MRADLTGVNDPHNLYIMLRILYADEIQFRRMFQVLGDVSDSLLEDPSQYLRGRWSYNTKQNIPASLKLGIALFYMLAVKASREALNPNFSQQDARLSEFWST